MAIAEMKWKLVKDTYFFDTTTCYLSEDGNHLFYSGNEKRIEILIDDLNELVRKGCAMWLELGEYEFGLDKLSKCPTTTWYGIHQMLYSLEPWGVMKESKNSTRKSIKESKEINLINNVANKLRKITDAHVDTYQGADWISLSKDEYTIKIIYMRNELSIELYKDGDFKDGELEYASSLSDDDFSVNYIIDFIKNFIKNRNYLKNKISIKESKESAKSIRESKNSSILDDELYDLIEQGYIYDEDENGMNMSYGEYVAVSDDLWETLENELKYYRDFPSAYDAYNEIMDNTGDDTKMFMSISDDDYFYFEINEDENTYSFSGEVPTVLEKLFKKFLKETDFERV